MRDRNRCKTAETKVGGEWTETRCHQGSIQKWNPLPEDYPQQQRNTEAVWKHQWSCKSTTRPSTYQSAASPPSPGLPTHQCPGSEPLPQPPRPKRRRPESSADAGPSALPESGTAGDPDDLPFSFSGQGQWVATCYDEQFFIGQVIEVHSPQSAVVQYLEELKGRSNPFKWPKVEDVAETDSILYAFEGTLVWILWAVGVVCGRCLQWVSCVEGACSGCHPGEVWRNIQPLIKLTSSRIVFA